MSNKVLNEICIFGNGFLVGLLTFGNFPIEIKIVIWLLSGLTIMHLYKQTIKK